MKREIVLDTETTGLSPVTGHRIVEIGCVELINCIPTGRVWHCHVNPERDMPMPAFEVHGLSIEFLSTKPRFHELADDMLEFIEGAMLVMHNAAFDFAFLNAELERLQRQLLRWDRVVDTLALARRRHPGSPCSLDALCRRYGIDLSEREKHSALLDCRLLAASGTCGRASGAARFLNGAQEALLGANEAIQPRQDLSPGFRRRNQAHRAFIATLRAMHSGSRCAIVGRSCVAAQRIHPSLMGGGSTSSRARVGINGAGGLQRR
jgi:DNA polymerase-3 subunit epsilon